MSDTVKQALQNQYINLAYQFGDLTFKADSLKAKMAEINRALMELEKAEHNEQRDTPVQDPAG